ncbi:MAG: hemolysin family protein [Spirochaetota bacterium]
MNMRLFKRRRNNGLEEIIGEENGRIEKQERDMIRGIVELGETPVKSIMVPRTEVIAVPVDASFEEIVKTFIKSRHSRIPVYEETIDKVIGFLHAKDLLPFLARGEPVRDIRRVIRTVRFVPEGKMLDELLTELQQKKEHIAVVVDEYGGMAGIVCLENILEEIVGEIQDEYDNEEEDVKQVSENTFLCDARTLLEDINEELQVSLPTGGSDTLGGLVFDLLGRIPTVEETVSFQNLRFTVKSMDGNRVKKVQVCREQGGEQRPEKGREKGD